MRRWSTRRAGLVVLVAVAAAPVAVAVTAVAGLCDIGGESACSTADRAVASVGSVVTVACLLVVPVAAAILARQVRWLALPAVLLVAVVTYSELNAAAQRSATATLLATQREQRRLRVVVDAAVAWPPRTEPPPGASLATRLAALHRIAAADTAALQAGRPRLAAAGVSVVAVATPFAVTLRTGAGLFCLAAPSGPPPESVSPGACR